MLATARTFALLGVRAREVAVEVDVRGGLPAFALVGLPDAAVRESRDRVRAAIENSGFEFPRKRITASLAPADLPKAGTGFDLAIAAALLGASGQLSPELLAGCALVGELGLTGELRSAAGGLAMAEEAVRLAIPRLAVAAANGPEAALAARTAARGGPAGAPRIVPLERLAQLRLLGTDAEPGPPGGPDLGATAPAAARPDLAELRGQEGLRRALEITAAGGHGLLIVGPPGAGKSLAARCLPSLLPPLSGPEALEVARIASACGRSLDSVRGRPFRAPHHTVSTAGLIGGGNPPRPGEITLAHRGLLFLDELSEFSRTALEALRQPLEEGWVTISRSRHSIGLPCRFQLVAAANPCPCGRGEDDPDCSCDPVRASRYQARISGALADRVDIQLGVSQPSGEALAGDAGEASERVRERVVAARERQEHRLGAGRCNAEMTPAETRLRTRMTAGARALLEDGHRRMRLSGRGFDRVLRTARTIADLADRPEVDEEHVGEALGFRRKERPRLGVS